MKKKGNDPKVCTHRIHMEEGQEPKWLPQRRLNPRMMKVVKGEVLKLLDANIIYPIYKK